MGCRRALPSCPPLALLRQVRSLPLPLSWTTSARTYSLVIVLLYIKCNNQQNSLLGIAALHFEVCMQNHGMPFKRFSYSCLLPAKYSHSDTNFQATRIIFSVPPFSLLLSLLLLHFFLYRIQHRTTNKSSSVEQP